MSSEVTKQIFSNRLKFYMQIKRIKQSDIVRDLKQNSSTVSNWCQGIMIPRMDKLKLLADYLGVSVGDLIDDHTEEIEREKRELHYINTIAAHFDGDEYTDEEMQKIREYAEFIKSQRKN